MNIPKIDNLVIIHADDGLLSRLSDGEELKRRISERVSFVVNSGGRAFYVPFSRTDEYLPPYLCGMNVEVISSVPSKLRKITFFNNEQIVALKTRLVHSDVSELGGLYKNACVGRFYRDLKADGFDVFINPEICNSLKSFD